MEKKINADEILSLITAHEDDDDDAFRFWGIHTDDRNFSEGEILPHSYEKYQDDPMSSGYTYDSENALWIGEELDGTSCVGICDLWVKCTLQDIKKALEDVRLYAFYDHAYLVASYSADSGNDLGEYVSYDAKVVKKLY